MSNRTRSTSEPKVCLVTGSHGFLGEHLTQQLEQRGYKVIRGDREGNIPKGIDWVFDCATWGNKNSHLKINDIINANVRRVEDLLDNALKKKVQTVILISSSSVKLPLQTPYSASKVLMEYIAIGYVGSALRFAVVRPYTLYGPGDKDHLIPTVFDACLTGKTLRLDPKPVHDYIYIDDFVSRLIYTAENISLFEGKIHELGSGIPTSNAQVVKMIELITGKKANIEIVDNLRTYDNQNWYYQGNHIKLETDLAEGLIKTYESIKQSNKTTYH